MIFSLQSSHFSVKSLVEDLNKEPEGSIVPIAVEETRAHLRAALPLSGSSHFNIILILLKTMREKYLWLVNLLKAKK